MLTNNWKNCRRQIPKNGAEAQDDFSALKRHTLDVVHEEKLAKAAVIHNCAQLNGLESTPLVYLISPTPNKVYKRVHLLKVWDHVRFKCFYDEENNFCQEPVLLHMIHHDSFASCHRFSWISVGSCQLFNVSKSIVA